jgi:hypothetical protein
MYSVEYVHRCLTNTFFEILHTSLVLILIYCRHTCRPTVAKLVTLHGARYNGSLYLVKQTYSIHQKMV